ncbi:YHYH protein [Solirhodobacter olei]|uniref:YHYH protein n=1 Tax=Solirhodobacter olei TaxID=2493082 RepID=UPI000FD91154|nr:YHYH protein [Solirhodobacter olei]
MHRILVACALFAMAATPALAHTGTREPLGDGKISSTPRVGYLMSCPTRGSGRGAFRDGPWIDGKYWYPGDKISVEGHISWSSARFSVSTVTRNGTSWRKISGNGLPVKATTGRFPISSSDPAYNYDRNPNSVRSVRINMMVPADPKKAASASCVPMGMIGVALDGVAIFNAIDAGGRDAPAHEVQDSCHGHPERSGEYHYHGPSPCMPGINGKAQLVGYALDGFGIYSLRDAKGHLMTDAKLDACHGTTSTVMWNGKPTRIYHYVMTDEYPYSIGCFRGTPIRTR